MSSTSVFRRVATLPSAARAFSTSQRASLARMQVIGRLTKEPELVNTSTGKEMIRYAVASDSGPKDNRFTSFFRVANFSEGAQKDFVLSLPKG
jgi:hypothetical protein